MMTPSAPLGRSRGGEPHLVLLICVDDLKPALGCFGTPARPAATHRAWRGHACPKSPAKKGGKQDRDAAFDTCDENKDGKLSREEFLPNQPDPDQAPAGRESTVRQLPRFVAQNPCRRLAVAVLRVDCSKRPRTTVAHGRRLEAAGTGSWVAATDQSPRIGTMNQRLKTQR